MDGICLLPSGVSALGADNGVGITCSLPCAVGGLCADNCVDVTCSLLGGVGVLSVDNGVDSTCSLLGSVGVLSVDNAGDSTCSLPGGVGVGADVTELPTDGLQRASMLLDRVDVAGELRDRFRFDHHETTVPFPVFCCRLRMVSGRGRRCPAVLR